MPGDVIARAMELTRPQARLLLSEPTPNESQKELFRDTLYLDEMGLSDEEKWTVLKAKFSSYYREKTHREFERAIERGRVEAVEEKKGPRYPRRNARSVEDALAETPGGLEALRGASQRQEFVPQQQPRGKERQHPP